MVQVLVQRDIKELDMRGRECTDGSGED
jgi:hypothetical protein